MRFIYVFFALCLLAPGAQAQTPPDPAKPCAGGDKACLFGRLEETAKTIPEQSWQDATWREMAKLLTIEGDTDRAISLISKIKTPDTQAMTIRGIGMAAAPLKWERTRYNALFTRLTEEAGKISHPPSHAIALNYIADSQALSGDDDASLKTAKSIDNAEMRNKAFYDSAKIQAEAGRLDAALGGIASINDVGFRNKALRTVSKIRADGTDYDGALKAADKIENPYQKAQAVLYILVKQIAPEEVSIE